MCVLAVLRVCVFLYSGSIFVRTDWSFQPLEGQRFNKSQNMINNDQQWYIEERREGPYFWKGQDRWISNQLIIKPNICYFARYQQPDFIFQIFDKINKFKSVLLWLCCSSSPSPFTSLWSCFSKFQIFLLWINSWAYESTTDKSLDDKFGHTRLIDRKGDCES